MVLLTTKTLEGIILGIHRLLEEIRESSSSSKEVGDKFERLMLAFFRVEPTYEAQFKNVWLWSDWPNRKGLPDTGIDLVAENVDGSGFTAIQCKNYAPTTILDKKDIDSFFTESGKAPFTHRIIVSTTNLWTVHAENSLKGQDKPVRRIGIDALANSMIDWDSLSAEKITRLKLVDGKKRRKHQIEAITAVLDGFKEHDRGKLIMACGTGKTYTAQCISEDLVGTGGNVLLLVPSISLLSQTVKEWTADSSIPINVFAVCSDAKAGRRRETEDMSPYDLAIPATTDTKLLIEKFQKVSSKDKMNVILSTYQSIGIIHEAQKLGFGKFDLIIADEAHRTTGVTLMGEEDSAFTRVHDDSYLKGAKRLYMTATPRVYGDSAKAKADAADALLASMDDYQTYGEEFYRLGFAEAVNRDLLTDYKVLVLTVNEDAVASAFQQQLSDSNHELKLDDATRIVGCLNAFAKHDPTGNYFTHDHSPMKRIVAFSNTINNSKKFKELFSEVSERFKSYTESDLAISVAVDHVDGSFNSFKREELLGWLKSEPPQSMCHVLSNAKCLTEGVDVPSLDAIVFLEPRNSMVDVIQAVGRVMRKNADKKYGYVILPIGIPAGISPEEALSDNKRYAGVWQVLNALRSHDERINAVVNKLDLNNEAPDMIEIVPVGFSEESEPLNSSDDGEEKPRALQLEFPLEEIRQAIFAKMVEKVGTRQYWETWAKDVAQIAERHVSQINEFLEKPNSKVAKEFKAFLKGLQGNLNESITQEDAIEMLAQHLITQPVFEAIFGESGFAQSNSVSKVMQSMVEVLEEKFIDTDKKILESFYADVRLRVAGIDNLEGKQRVITELYEKFFKYAFPRTAEKLGIVYTPIEVVDFILNSVQVVLKNEFDTSLSEKNVHIIDPFTGTGTFIARLLQSGHIQKKDILQKYRHEIHANEIILLAYYIAAVNIESVFGSMNGGKYEPFDGLVLTDTFQMFESEDTFDDIVFKENNEKVTRQKNTDIRVVIGNPPYSVGQSDANQGNQNMKYPDLDASVRKTYAKLSSSTNVRAIYDSYFKAFRWATDRLKEQGVVCFVTNGSWIDSNSADGFRNSLQNEFSRVYVFNLRGNARTSGEQRRMEAGNVFGEGSRTPVTITLLIKNPKHKGPTEIFYHDIGDYLNREDKLKTISKYQSYEEIPWLRLAPNESGDWINQRDSTYSTFIPLGDKVTKGKEGEAIFRIFSGGMQTNRDSWNYNFSKKSLIENVKRMVLNYNSYVSQFIKGDSSLEDLTRVSANQISWSRNLLNSLQNGKLATFEQSEITLSQYRPFHKMWLYRDNIFVGYRALTHVLFPGESKNLLICTTGPGASVDFSALVSENLPNNHFVDTGQHFPLYYYPEMKSKGSGEMLFGEDLGTSKVDAISDWALNLFRKEYRESVSREDIFYYVYGVLSAPEFVSRFKYELKKEAPRIPLLKEFDEYAQFGKELAHIHLNYESFTNDFVTVNISKSTNDESKLYRVEKIRFEKKDDKSSIIFNQFIKISGIPIESYAYVVNGKSPIEWVMDRYVTKVDADSGISNDPNDFSEDPKYVLNLLLSVIAMTTKVLELQKTLPKLEIPK
jgi:predicted helicase